MIAPENDIERFITSDSAGLVIVPDRLNDAINRIIDEAIANLEPDAETDRPYFREMLLRYFAEHGVLPEIEIERR